MTYYLKDPRSRVDYAIDYAIGYLDGQTIAASAWTICPAEPGGIAVDGSGFDLMRTGATLTGGIAGHVYSVGNQVTLSDGQIDQRSVTIRVEDR